MSTVMTITIPDETARRIEAVAAARGETIEHVAAEALDSSPLLTAEATDYALEAFIGYSDSGDPHWAGTEVRELRRDLIVPQCSGHRSGDAFVEIGLTRT